jgi:hypothetical protein
MIELWTELWLEFFDLWGIPVVRGRKASIAKVWPL